MPRSAPACAVPSHFSNRPRKAEETASIVWASSFITVSSMTRCVPRVYASLPKRNWIPFPRTHTCLSVRMALHSEPTSGCPPAVMPVPIRPVPMCGRFMKLFRLPRRTQPSSSSAMKSIPRSSVSAALQAETRISAALLRRQCGSCRHASRPTRRSSPSHRPPSTSANGKNFVNSSKTYIQTQKFLIQYAK